MNESSYQKRVGCQKCGFVFALPDPPYSICSVCTWIFFTVARSLTHLRQSLFHLLYLSPLAHKENCYVKCRAVDSIQFKISPLGYEFLYGLISRKQTLVREGTWTMWHLFLKELIKIFWLLCCQFYPKGPYLLHKF